MGLGLFLGGAATGAMSGYKLAQQYKDAQKQQGLKRAYGQGSEVTQQYSPEQAAQMEAAASAINPETGQPYYNVSTSPEGQYTFTTQGQEPLAGTMAPQYRLGAETGGTYTPEAPTEAQRHRGGLVSQQRYLASAGDTEEAAKIGEQLQTSDVRDLQLKGLERQEADAAKDTDFRTKAPALIEERNKYSPGTPEYKKANDAFYSEHLKTYGADKTTAFKLAELQTDKVASELEQHRVKVDVIKNSDTAQNLASYLSKTTGRKVEVFDSKDGNTYILEDKTGDSVVDERDLTAGAVSYGRFPKGKWDDYRPTALAALSPEIQATLVTEQIKHGFAEKEAATKFGHEKELKQMDVTARKEVAGLRASGKAATYIAEDGRAVEKDPESDTGWSYADGSKFSGVPRLVSARDTTQAKPPTVAEYNAWAVNNEKAKGETDKQHMARFKAVVTALSGSPASTQATTPAQGPAIGTVYNGKTFKGGDPNKKESWEVSAPPPPVEKLTYGQQAAAARRGAFFGTPERVRAEREAELARTRGLYTGK